MKELTISDEDKKIVSIAMRLLYSTIERLESDGLDIIDYGDGISKNAIFWAADRLGIDLQ